MDKFFKEYDEWIRKHSKDAQVLIETKDKMAVGAIYLTVHPHCPQIAVDSLLKEIKEKSATIVGSFANEVLKEVTLELSAKDIQRSILEACLNEDELDGKSVGK
jgi:hypothetical protein